MKEDFFTFENVLIEVKFSKIYICKLSFRTKLKLAWTRWTWISFQNLIIKLLTKANVVAEKSTGVRSIITVTGAQIRFKFCRLLAYKLTSSLVAFCTYILQPFGLHMVTLSSSFFNPSWNRYWRSSYGCERRRDELSTFRAFLLLVDEAGSPNRSNILCHQCAQGGCRGLLRVWYLCQGVKEGNDF